MPIASLPTSGSIVTCRGRQWVVMPSEQADLLRLRPLSGNEEQVCGIYLPLLEQGLENLDSAQFPVPTSEAIQDHTAAQLLMDAARLSLRSGAGPFRCLGRLSVRPRPYQLVPLLMALRLDTVRLLIADDVGIGKTIEAGLIARELLDRGEVRRLAVVCPPHLCDQWQRELREKFHIDAVVVRSGTVSKLERSLPAGDHHIFSYYRHIIVSLDYAKSDRRRASFLTHCPDLVIVDEAHTCARPGGRSESQQMRHQLVREIAQNPAQHLMLLTATPHSGIEASFLSLLGLLRPEFEHYDLEHLSEKQRIDLARHFVQRRRADVKLWLGNETPFPDREPLEKSYRLSQQYTALFEAVYDFARGLVKTTTEDMTYAQRRGRYWSALAIIRCVMSSPEAAIATLGRQLEKVTEADLTADIDEDLMVAYTYDPTDQEQALDAQPTSAIAQGQRSFQDRDRRKLRAFLKDAEALKGNADAKWRAAADIIADLLQEGLNPIVWCRYIATANYLTEVLKATFEKKRGSKARVVAVTGEQAEDEREARIAELATYPMRILVATDCLSEGVNLQEHFQAVIHYDLPWNPNRLEQREGRIDRYGQPAPQVKTYLLYGQDNPVDGAVLNVLIRKAVEIHRKLGITVPVPMDSATVSEAVFKSLFDHTTDAEQLSLLDLLDRDETAETQVHKSWDRAVERETRSAAPALPNGPLSPPKWSKNWWSRIAFSGMRRQLSGLCYHACERLSHSLIKKKQGWLLPSIPSCLQSRFWVRNRCCCPLRPQPQQG
jgi:superfamily II DNA or RNA helicase